MEKPDVDQIEGLSPAISIEQRTAGRNPRSTVGHRHRDLRLPAPPLRPDRRASTATQCGRPISRQTVQEMVDRRPATRRREAASRSSRPSSAAGRGSTGRRWTQWRKPGLRPRAHRRRVRRARGRARRSTRRRSTRSRSWSTAWWPMPRQRSGSPTRWRRRSSSAEGMALVLDGGRREETLLREQRRLPALRHLLRAARAAILLLQQPLRRLPDVRRARHHDGDRPELRDPRPDEVARATGRVAVWRRCRTGPGRTGSSRRSRSATSLDSTRPSEEAPGSGAAGDPLRARRREDRRPVQGRARQVVKHKERFERGHPEAHAPLSARPPSDCDPRADREAT